MKLSNRFKRYTRKSHRYLGVMIGVQFLFWTIGGLYFSWSDIDEIHGDFNKKELSYISVDQKYFELDSILYKLSLVQKLDSIKQIKTVKILDTVYYQIDFFVKDHDKQNIRSLFFDVSSGKIKPAISESEAVEIARKAFKPESNIKSITLVTKENVNGHHEFRGGELPTYAVEMEHESNTVVYIGKVSGQVYKFRNQKWRFFDFLWMMHTMDYQNRDDFNNLVLRIFSILGLLTILSGFILFFISYRVKK